METVAAGGHDGSDNAEERMHNAAQVSDQVTGPMATELEDFCFCLSSVLLSGWLRTQSFTLYYLTMKLFFQLCLIVCTDEKHVATL